MPVLSKLSELSLTKIVRVFLTMSKSFWQNLSELSELSESDRQILISNKIVPFVWNRNFVRIVRATQFWQSRHFHQIQHFVLTFPANQTFFFRILVLKQLGARNEKRNCLFLDFFAGVPDVDYALGYFHFNEWSFFDVFMTKTESIRISYPAS